MTTPSGAHRILVVTSCTGEKKAHGNPGLEQADFADPVRLRGREAELRNLMHPAGAMYTGQQHERAMRGVTLLRNGLGADAIDVLILSAGYGLIAEDQLVAPYDVIFNQMRKREAREWAARLDAARSLRARMGGYDLVLVLLGSAYLDAVAPPLPVAPRQRIVYFAKEAEAPRIMPGGGVLVPSGAAESTRYSCGIIGLKGEMLRLFGTAVDRHGPRLVDAVIADPTNATMTNILEREAAP